MTKSASAKTFRISAKSPRRTTITRSTARNLSKSAKGWKGDDLEEIMTIVAATRSRSRF